MESEVWLYPAHFIETFCITALEAMASKCYPIATSIGALKNTIGEFDKLGMACLINERADTAVMQQHYALFVVDAIKQQKWRTIEYPLSKISWESVARDWINRFNLAPALRSVESGQILASP